MDLIARTSFGLPADPWSGVDADTADVLRVRALVKAAVEARAMVSVLGMRGSGKTHAVRRALREAGARVVEPLRLDRGRLHMGDVETALVRELSDETPRRSGEARSHQTRRLLGAASRDGTVCLLLDDSHLMHGRTLRALKRLREWAWLGRSPLLAVVLVGQADKAATVPEVGLRSDRAWLAGLTESEAREALAGALNPPGRSRERADAGALDLMASSPRARNWLDLQTLADECLAAANAAGSPSLTADSVAAVLSPPAADAEPPAAPSDEAVAAALARRRSPAKAA